MEKYKLKDGPQILVWEESDKKLVIEVLMFSKLLVENCSNRSLYGSSAVSHSYKWHFRLLSNPRPAAHQRTPEYHRLRCPHRSIKPGCPTGSKVLHISN